MQQVYVPLPTHLIVEDGAIFYGLGLRSPRGFSYPMPPLNSEKLFEYFRQGSGGLQYRLLGRHQ